MTDVVAKYPDVVAAAQTVKDWSEVEASKFLNLLQFFDCVMVHVCNGKYLPAAVTHDVIMRTAALLSELIVAEFQFKNLASLSMGWSKYSCWIFLTRNRLRVPKYF